MRTNPTHERPGSRPLAAITGASSGIGFELARCCAKQGFDLLVAANEPAIEDVARNLRAMGVSVKGVEADLATREGADIFCATAGGRPIEVLLANAASPPRRAFLDRDVNDVRRIVETDVTGTAYLIHKVGAEMRARQSGRILITGSIAGLIPGSRSVASDGTDAFVDAFSCALRNELDESGVSVTCLVPGLAQADLFEPAEVLDRKLARRKKDDPAVAARIGFEAMMKGEGEVVTGLRNALPAAAAAQVPPSVLAQRHRKHGRGRKRAPAVVDSTRTRHWESIVR